MTFLLAAHAPPQEIVAIDVVLEPDATLIKNAEAVNARLRQNDPKGYALDAAHAPHITLVQRFVRASDVGPVGAAVSQAVESGPTPPLKLTTTGYGSAPWGGAAVVYTVERSPQLLELANNIVEAVKPFSVSGGGADAFIASRGETINADTIKTVEEFVPGSSGQNYQPHIKLGTADPDFAKQLKAAPFETFTFTGVNVAIYQLGNLGTWEKRLWVWRQQ
jgi:hypothetical protein